AEVTFLENEPANGLLEDAPADVFAHLAPLVDLQFAVQIITGRAGRYFSDQIGRTLDVVVCADDDAAAVARLNDHERIGLWFVFEIQAHGSVTGAPDARSECPVIA